MRAKRFIVLCVILCQALTAQAALRPLWTAVQANVGDPALATVDRSGNTFTVGGSFSDGTLTLAKRGFHGRMVWTSSIPETAIPLGMAVDSAGNVYVTGTIYQAGNPTNFADVVTWRFNPTGQLLWRTIYTGPDNTDDFATGIGLDEAGRIYVTVRSFHRFKPSTETYHDVVRYDAEGNVVWARRAVAAPGGANNTGMWAINPHGGVVAATAYSVVSFSADGTLLWSWQSDGSFLAAFDSVSFRIAGFDHADNLYLGGYAATNGMTRPLPAVRKFSSSGEILWTAAYRGPAENPGETVDLRVDEEGRTYLGIDAAIACRLVPGDEEQELECDFRPAIVSFDVDGAFRWVSRFGDDLNHGFFFAGMALKADGSVTVVARTYPLPMGLPIEISHDTFIGQCDNDGNQFSSGFFHYESSSELWPLSPFYDKRGSLYLPAELIDRGGSGDVNFLIAKFHLPSRKNRSVHLPRRY